MRVLSLFDGVSCGMIALQKAGIKVDRYYASEIDKYAQIVSGKNYPGIIRLGDVNRWREWIDDIGNIDLLLAGFPCQAWSVAGKQGGLDDIRGQLALCLSDIFEHTKQKNQKLLFLFENVRMKKENLDYMDKLFGVEHIKINSSLLSAQNRLRCYWCNWHVEQPSDKGILLQDIVHEESIVDRDKSFCVDANYYRGGNLKHYYTKSRRQIVFDWLKEYIVPFDKTLQILNKEIVKGKIGYFRKDSQVCGDAGGGDAKMGQYLFGCITPESINKRQNGQRFNDGKKFYTLTARDRQGVLVEGYIRKLTPIECERLQTIPDNYTAVHGVSNTQRYKMLGNGWTVDVITHIFTECDMFGLRRMRQYVCC